MIRMFGEITDKLHPLLVSTWLYWWSLPEAVKCNHQGHQDCRPLGGDNSSRSYCHSWLTMLLTALWFFNYKQLMDPQTPNSKLNKVKYCTYMFQNQNESWHFQKKLHLIFHINFIGFLFHSVKFIHLKLWHNPLK